MAVDGSGNAFVAGYSTSSGGDYDYATIKYSSGGLPLWTNRYNGPANSNDLATAVAVDSSGNAFVTGESWGVGTNRDYATVAYSATGVSLWTNRYHGPADGFDIAFALAVDGQGNAFVTGASPVGRGAGYATVAYSGAGSPLWTNRYNGASSWGDEAWAIAMDSCGNVFVTGRSLGTNFAGYATINYSSTGVPLWTNRYQGPGNRGDWARAAAVDSSGDVLVTGLSAGSDWDNDYATIKYSKDGAPLWTNRYDGPGHDGDEAYAIAVDRNGNVFVTGYSTDTNRSFDFTTLGYSAAGVPLWTNYYDAGNGYSVASAIAVDGWGNVFVAGSSLGQSNFQYATVGYSGSGVPLWTNLYSGVASGEAEGQAIAVDDQGNLFVTGSSIGDDGFRQYATIKYSSSIPPVHLTIEPDGGGGYFIRFKGVPGSAYRLERATELSGPWTSSAPQKAPDSGLVEFWDLFPPLGQGFYRVRRE